MDADSISSRFRILIPIILSVCHVLACVWWYLGTAQLPPIWETNMGQGNGTSFNITVYEIAVCACPLHARGHDAGTCGAGMQCHLMR